jgi:hypothetical protein
MAIELIIDHGVRRTIPRAWTIVVLALASWGVVSILALLAWALIAALG